MLQKDGMSSRDLIQSQSKNKLPWLHTKQHTQKPVVSLIPANKVRNSIRSTGKKQTVLGARGQGWKSWGGKVIWLSAEMLPVNAEVRGLLYLWVKHSLLACKWQSRLEGASGFCNLFIDRDTGDHSLVKTWLTEWCDIQCCFSKYYSFLRLLFSMKPLFHIITAFINSS